MLIDYTAPAQREVLLLLLLVKIVLVFQLPLSTTWLNGDRFEHSSYQNKKEVVKKSIVGGNVLLAEARTYCARSPHCQPLHLSFGSRQFPPSQGGGEGLL